MPKQSPIPRGRGGSGVKAVTGSTSVVRIGADKRSGKTNGPGGMSRSGHHESGHHGAGAPNAGPGGMTGSC